MNDYGKDEAESIDLNELLKGLRDHQFELLVKSERIQVVLATLPPGHSSSRLPTVNKDSDQIIYLIDGEARADAGGVSHELCAGALLSISAGQKHQIINTGSRRLVYLGFFSPPAY